MVSHVDRFVIKQYGIAIHNWVEVSHIDHILYQCCIFGDYRLVDLFSGLPFVKVYADLPITLDPVSCNDFNCYYGDCISP